MTCSSAPSASASRRRLKLKSSPCPPRQTTRPLTLTRRATPSGADVDTVRYLHREGATGWGRALTSNDDSVGSLFSAISRNLVAGQYRVLVKGYVRPSSSQKRVCSRTRGVSTSARYCASHWC